MLRPLTPSTESSVSSRPSTGVTSEHEEIDPREPAWGAYIPPKSRSNPQLLPKLDPSTEKGWEFLEAPDSPRHMIFNFEALERRARLESFFLENFDSGSAPESKNVSPTRTSASSRNGFRFKEGVVAIKRFMEKKWQASYLVVDTNVPIVFLFRTKLKKTIVGTFDLRITVIQPTGSVKINSLGDSLFTFLLRPKNQKNKRGQEKKNESISIASNDRDDYLNWLHHLHLANQQKHFSPAHKKILPALTPVNTKDVTPRKPEDLALLRENERLRALEKRLSPKPRFLEIEGTASGDSNEKISHPLKNLINEVGYILKESYPNGPILPYKQQGWSALVIQTWYRGIAARHFVWGPHGLKRMTWAAILVQRNLLGARVRWHMRKVKRHASRIQHLWRTHKFARQMERTIREHKKRMKRASAFFKNIVLVRMVANWRKFAIKQKKASKLMTRVFQGVKAYSFFVWYDFCEHRKNIRKEKLKLMRKKNNRKAKYFLKQMMNSHAVRALQSWRAYIERKQKMRALFGRVMHGELKTHFFAWNVLKDQLKQGRRLRKKVFRHLFDRYFVKWELYLLYSQAARAIQGVYKLHWTRWYIASEARWFKYCIVCASKIQRLARVYIAYKRVFGPRGMLMCKRCSTRIQTWWRCVSEQNKYQYFLYRLRLIQDRSRFWLRRRQTASIAIQHAWRVHWKYSQERDYAAKVIQRSWRTFSSCQIFARIKYFLHESFFQQDRVYMEVVKVSSGYNHYCLFSAEYYDRILYIKLTKTSTGQTFSLQVTCIELIEIIENDEDLRFKPCSFEAVVKKTVKDWIKFDLRPPKPVVFQVANRDRLLVDVASQIALQSKHPVEDLKIDRDLDFYGIGTDAVFQMMAHLTRPYGINDAEKVQLWFSSCKTIEALVFELARLIEATPEIDLVPERRGMGISLKKNSLVYRIEYSIQFMRGKRLSLQQSLEGLSQDISSAKVQVENICVKAELSRNRLLKSQKDCLAAHNELKNSRDKEAAAREELDDFSEHIVGTLDHKLGKAKTKVGLLKIHLEGGFYYDQLPALYLSLENAKKGLVDAKADIEMIEYDSDDIEELSDHIKKTNKKIARIIKELEKDEDWNVLKQTEKLVPGIVYALEEAESTEEELKRRWQELDETVKQQESRLERLNLLQHKTSVHSENCLQEKLVTIDEYNRLETRLLRTRGRIQSLFTMINVKKNELEKAQQWSKIPSVFQTLHTVLKMFCANVFPVLQAKQPEVDRLVAEYAYSSKVNSSKAVNTVTALLRNIEKYKATLRPGEKLPLARAIIQDFDAANMTLPFFGGIDAVKAQIKIILLFERCAQKLFGSIEKILLKALRTHILNQIPHMQVSENNEPAAFSSWEVHAEEKLQLCSAMNYQSYTVAEQIGLYGDRARRDFRLMTERINAEVDKCDEMIETYEDLLAQKKKKNLAGAIDMRIRAGIIDIIQRSQSKKRRLKEILDCQIAKHFNGLLLKMTHARQALITKSNGLELSNKKTFHEIRDGLSSLLAAVGINRMEEVSKLKVHVQHEVHSLIWDKLSMMDQTAIFLSELCKIQFQTVQYIEDDLKRFLENYQMLIEEISEEKLRFFDELRYLEMKYDMAKHKRAHQEKRDAREEAKQYGGNLEFVKRLRRRRFACMQIQQAWRSSRRRIQIEMVPLIWDEINMGIDSLKKNVQMLYDYVENEKDRIIPFYDAEEEIDSEQPVSKFVIECISIRKLSRMLQEFQSAGASRYLAQCSFRIVDIRKITRDIAPLVTKIGYVKYRGSKAAKKEMTELLKTAKMLDDRIFEIIYIYRPEERDVYEEDSVFEEVEIKVEKNDNANPSWQKKAYKFVVNPTTKKIARTARRKAILAGRAAKRQIRYILWKNFPGTVHAPYDMQMLGATKFQALVRGHITRVKLNIVFESDSDSEEEESEDEEYIALLTQAACVIQRSYRCKMARYALRDFIAENFEKLKDATSNKYVYLNLVTKETQVEKPRLLGQFDLASPRSRARGLKFNQAYYQMKRWRKKERKRLGNVLMHSIIRKCAQTYCDKAEPFPKAFQECSNKCGKVWYCSKGCERIDWARHRKSCIRAQRLKSEGQPDDDKPPLKFLDATMVDDRIEGVINKALDHLQQTGFLPDSDALAEY